MFSLMKPMTGFGATTEGMAITKTYQPKVAAAITEKLATRPLNRTNSI
jgi:hypothetical protein